MKKYRYGFIGCGNMGGALVGVAAQAIGGENIAICDSNAEKTSALKEKFGVEILDARTLAQSCKYIVMGVKPQAMQTAVSEIKKELCNQKEAVVVSMAAGLSIEKILGYLGENYVGGVIRIMPNLPCALGVGVILYSTMGTSNEDKNAFVKDFCLAGLLDEIDEKDMDGASALTGCGPAFVYYFAEGLIRGTTECGLSEERARKYAAQTILGGAKALLTGENPEALRKKVCSPKGTTLEGIAALDEGAFLDTVSAAVKAAKRRAEELQRDN